MKTLLALALSGAPALLLTLGCATPTTMPESERAAAELQVAGREATAPLASRPEARLVASEKGWGGFFPLEVGRTWAYSGTFYGWFTPYGGEPEPILDSDYHYDLLWEIEGTSVLHGEEYARIRETLQEASGEFQFCLYYRQTKDGLFERNDPCESSHRVSAAPRRTSVLPALRSLPGISSERLLVAAESARARLARFGVAGAHARTTLDVRPQHEGLPTLRRLDYPLHPNSEWQVVVYDGELEFRSRVVGHDRSHGTRVWKIRMLASAFGPRDEVYLYFSERGYHGYEAHLFQTATDETGAPIGELEYIEILEPRPAGGFIPGSE